MNHHCQQASHLQEILSHTTTHPNRYHIYQMTLIQTQDRQIILRRTYQTHWTPDILNKNYAHVRNFVVNSITMNLLKSVPILKPIYLKLRTIPRLQGLKWMRILYSAVFSLNFINSLKRFLSKFKQTCMLLMDYPSIRAEYFPDYAKKAIWDLFRAYIMMHIDKC